MKNFNQIMQQAQKMQTKMAEMQDEMAAKVFEGKAAGGMVIISMNGKNEPKSVKIDPSLMNAEEVEVLEDLIITAWNDARSKSEAGMAEEMQKLTGGMGLPSGFKLPF